MLRHYEYRPAPSVVDHPPRCLGGVINLLSCFLVLMAFLGLLCLLYKYPSLYFIGAASGLLWHMCYCGGGGGGGGGCVETLDIKV